jgi:hypothetical protein
MPRPSKRKLCRGQRERLALGVLRAWRPDDTVATVAARFNMPKHRIVEALSGAFAAVRSRKGMTADDIAAETGLPRAFVGHAMRAAYGMRDAKREQDSVAVQKAARRYQGFGVSRPEALREARNAYGSKVD